MSRIPFLRLPTRPDHREGGRPRRRPVDFVGNGQDQIISRSRLQGEIDQSSLDITAEAIEVARLTAQLESRNALQPDDIPLRARPYINKALSETLTKTAETRLVAGNAMLKTQIELLQQNLDELSGAVDTLTKLAENQKSAIQYSQDDYNRADGLLEKGLKTATEVSALQRQLTLDEGRLLTIYAQISSSRNNMGSLKREFGNGPEYLAPNGLDEPARIAVEG